MASTEDTDDLYADLYADSVDQDANPSSGAVEDGDEDDLIMYSEEPAAKPAASASSAKTPFIPPAAGSSSSFIPPAPTASNSTTDSSQQRPGQSAQAGSSGQSAAPGAGNDTPAQSTADQSAANKEGEGDGKGPIQPHEMREEGKMFVGGLNWDTTDESLRNYFSQFGEVEHCTIMRDALTGRSRCFAFLTFVDPKAVNTVMVREHFLDGKVIDPKRAIPRPEQNVSRSQKVFVGGLPQSVNSDSFRTFFEQFGTVIDSTCMMDKETGNPRGFGFVTFQDETSVQHLLSIQPVNFEGKMVEVKRAQTKADTAAGARGAGGMGGMGGMRHDGGRGGGSGFAQSMAGGSGAGMGMGMGGMSGGMGMMNPMMNPMAMGMMGAGAGGGGSSGGAAAGAGPVGSGGSGGSGGGGFDPAAMARMYQQMGWGSAQWNPQMAWQQMMASMGGMGGMDMGGMGGMAGMSGMGGMPMGGMGGMANYNGGGGGGGWGNNGNSNSGGGGGGGGRNGSNSGGYRQPAPPPRSGGSTLPPPSSVGLPSRPMSGSPPASGGYDRDRSSSRHRDGGGGSGGGGGGGADSRDVHRRERSPQRGGGRNYEGQQQRGQRY